MLHEYRDVGASQVAWASFFLRLRSHLQIQNRYAKVMLTKTTWRHSSAPCQLEGDPTSAFLQTKKKKIFVFSFKKVSLNKLRHGSGIWKLLKHPEKWTHSSRRSLRWYTRPWSSDQNSLKFYDMLFRTCGMNLLQENPLSPSLILK